LIYPVVEGATAATIQNFRRVNIRCSLHKLSRKVAGVLVKRSYHPNRSYSLRDKTSS